MAGDLDLIRHALRVAREHKFAELSMHSGEMEFSAVLQPAHKSTPVVAAVSFEDLGPGVMPVTAPVVGYFREGAEPLAVGKRVEKGSIVGVVAALGLANDVEAPIAGEIVEVLVEANQPVEFGQPIAMLRANA